MDGHLWQIALLAERTDGPRGARDLSAEHEALTALVQAIMEAEVTERVGADYGERAPERLTQRNGYRPRPWDTRVGTLGLRIPKRSVKGATSRRSWSRGGEANGRFCRSCNRPTWRASPPGAWTTWG